MDKKFSKKELLKARRYLSSVAPLLNGSDFDRSIKAIHYGLSICRSFTATTTLHSNLDFEYVLSNAITVLSETLIAQKYIEIPLAYNPGSEEALQRQLEEVLTRIHEYQ